MRRETAAARDFAATWREADGEVVASTWGGTMCWFPRKPWRLRLVREGFEHVIRCGECPGCLELDRRRLSERLEARYPDRTVALYGARIHVPLERHSDVSHRLHRVRGCELEPGFFRLGRSSFVVLGRSRGNLRAACKRAGLSVDVVKIHRRRGRRAWRPLTAGLTVSREAYGEQVKRWYARGLPVLDKLTWTVEKLSKYQSFDRWRSPRARQDHGLVLVPPEVWRMRRVDRQAWRRTMRSVGSPELAGAIAQVLAAQIVRNPPAAQELKTDAAARPRPLKTLLPPIREGGYTSSGHTTSDLFPKPRSDVELNEPGSSGRPLWMERELEKLAKTEEANEARRQRLLRQSLDTIERIKQLAAARAKGDQEPRK